MDLGYFAFAISDSSDIRNLILTFLSKWFGEFQNSDMRNVENQKHESQQIISTKNWVSDFWYRKYRNSETGDTPNNLNKN